MIEKFHLVSGKENLIRPNLTPNVSDSLFEFATDEEYKEYINNNPQGLRWESAGKEVKFFQKPFNLFGLPTADLKKVIIIYPHDHPAYPEPSNAVIYNEDGSVHRQLTVPKLISQLAKQRAKFMNYEAPLKFYFDRVRWSRNSKGEIITVIQIGFDRDWFEERELNPETGEFGECISSGQR